MKKSLTRAVVLAAIVALATAVLAGGAWGVNPFVDVAGNQHEANIDAIYNAGITTGCDGTHYCPADFVTRAQMGTFLARTAGVGKGNFAKTNGRADRGAYCAIARANPGAVPVGPCGSAAHSVSAPGLSGRVSVAVGVDGWLIIAYQSGPDVRILLCNDAACSSPIDKTIGSGATLTSSHALAVGVDGFPIVAYRVVGGIGVSHCADIGCETGTATSFNDAGTGPADSVSLAIDPSGIPVVGYQRISTDGNVAFLRCSDVACGSFPTALELDTTGNTGFGTTIGFGGDGLPVVTYRRFGSPSKVMLAHCADALCASVDPPVEVADISMQTNILEPTLAIGANGLPLVIYANETFNAPALNDVIVAACANPGCTTSTKRTVSSSTNASGVELVAVIGLDGRPVIASINHDASNPETGEVLRCGDAVCTTASVVMSTPLVDPSFTAMALGLDGTPQFLVRDATILRMLRPST